MRFFDADAITAAVPIEELLDAVEAAYRDVAAGRDRSPMRSRVALPRGDLLMMPGGREGGAGSSVKLVTVMPDNPGSGLPPIQAVVVWFDSLTGEPLAVLEGKTLTAMRTGAASGVSARLMSRDRCPGPLPPGGRGPGRLAGARGARRPTDSRAAHLRPHPDPARGVRLGHGR